MVMEERGWEGPWGSIRGHKGTGGADRVDEVAAGDFPPAAGKRGINEQVDGGVEVRILGLETDEEFSPIAWTCREDPEKVVKVCDDWICYS